MNVHSSISHDNQKGEQPKCSTNEEWRHKMWLVYPQHGILFGQEKEWSPHLCHTVDKNRMPRERSQSQKTTHCMIPFIWSIQNKQMHRESTVATASGDQSLSDSWKVQAFFWRWWKCPKNLFWLWLHNSANRLKAITSYTWNGWFVWLVNYVSIMPLPKLIIN